MQSRRLETDTIGNEKFVVYRPEYRKSIINYQLQMLTNNEIQGLIPISRHQNNDEVSLLYNITGKQSLKEYMSEKGDKLNKNEFVQLIAAIVKLTEEIYPYQLPSGGIAADAEYIYLSSGKFNPAFIYIPVSEDDMDMSRLKSFFMDFVVNAKIEQTNDNFIQRFINLINSADFSLKKLKEFAKLTTGSAQPRKAEYKEIHKPVQVQQDYESPVERASDRANAMQDKYAPIRQEQEQRERPYNQQRSDMPQKKAKPQTKPQKNSDSGSQSNGSSKKKVIFALLSVAVIAAIAILYVSGAFMENGSLKTEYLGAAMLVGSAGLLIVYRELFVNNKDKSEDKTKPQKQPKQKSVKVSDTVPKPPKPMPVKPQPQRRVQETYKTVQPNYAQDYADDDGATDIMDDATAEAWLEMNENGAITKFYIGAHPILIGKQRSRVDYAIANNRVSKVHAEFGCMGGAYYVKDCHSTNGTYVNNGARIEPLEETEIVSGDTIRVADVDLIFKTR